MSEHGASVRTGTMRTDDHDVMLGRPARVAESWPDPVGAKGDDDE